MRAEVAEAAEEFTVDVDLVRVIEISRHDDTQRCCRPRCKVDLYGDLQPVPRVAGVGGISSSCPSRYEAGTAVKGTHRTIGQSQVHRAPMRVVKARLGPSQIVAGVKLPGPGQLDGRVAQHHPLLRAGCERGEHDGKAGQQADDAAQEFANVRAEWRTHPWQLCTANTYWQAKDEH